MGFRLALLVLSAAVATAAALPQARTFRPQDVLAARSTESDERNALESALIEKEGFDISSFTSAANAAADMAGGAVSAVNEGRTTSQREACIGCKFVLAKVKASTDQSSGYADVARSLMEVCSAMPDVFFDACDAMSAQEDNIVNDFLKGVKINLACQYAGLCWMEG